MKKKIFCFSIFVFIILLSSALLLSLLPETKTARALSSEPTLEIFGSSQIVLPADKAEVFVQIENLDTDPAIAKGKSIQQFEHAKRALISSGVSAENIKINSFTSNPNYDYSSGKTLVGYYAIINFSYELTDLNNYENSLNALIGADIADINYMNLTLSNADEVYQTALSLAVNNAIENAKNLLGKDVTLIKIEEQSNFYSPTIYKNHSLETELDSSIEICARVKIKCK